VARPELIDGKDRVAVTVFMSHIISPDLQSSGEFGWPMPTRTTDRARSPATELPHECDCAVVMPVFNDWTAAGLLLRDIALVLQREEFRATIVVVNDGSSDPLPDDFAADAGHSLVDVRVVNLRRNLGHQRAIAIGLAFVHDEVRCPSVVVMDADGEDRPDDIPRLLAKMRERGELEIVFAQRTRRSEGIIFTFFYHLYRFLHRVLTGISVQVGNFSVLPFDSVRTLVSMSDLWNHYAAAVFQSRMPFTMVPTARGRRVSGSSRMNLVSLTGHGLSAIAVFADRVGVRVLIGSMILLAVGVAAMLVGAVGVMSSRAGVAPVAVLVGGLILFVLLLQTCAAACFFVLLVLFARAGFSFVPSRDYHPFILSCERIRSPAVSVRV